MRASIAVEKYTKEKKSVHSKYRRSMLQEDCKGNIF